MTTAADDVVDPRAPSIRLALALTLWVGIHAFAILCSAPSRPRPTDAPEDEFSGARAVELIERLVAGVGPHPSGSPDAAVVRERVVAELEAIGLDPEVQEQIALSSRYGSAGRMRNVCARIRGRSRGDATLLVAHYDSVGAGPGVGDDLSGVGALIEVARAILSGPQPERTVLFLFTDGEEAGLLGATAFVESHPWMDEVGVVLNVEARGSSGPSLMFQTGEGDAWLVEHFARAARRPFTSSVYVELYKRLPNDTDFSIFLERDISGLNFAFVGGLCDYHTPNDSLARLDAGSVQHHGENLLATVRALDDADVEGRPRLEAVYSDVFGLFVWMLSPRMILLLSVLSVAGVVWGAHRAAVARVLDWGRLALGLVAAPAFVLAPVFVALVAVAGLRLVTGHTDPWWAHPTPMLFLYMGAVLATLASLSPVLARVAGPVGLAQGVWLWWAIAGLLAALFFPGASFLLVFPALAVVVPALVMRLWGDLDARLAHASTWGLGVAVVLWSPLVVGAVDTFGAGRSLFIAGPLAMCGSLAAPLFASAERRLLQALAGLGGLVVILATLAVWILPHRSEERPVALNLAYSVSSDGEDAYWTAETHGTPLPKAFAEAGAFEGRPSVGYRAPAPVLELEPPTFDLESERVGEEGERVLRGHLRSPARAARTRFQVVNVGSFSGLSVDGTPLTDRSGCTFLSVPEEGFELEFTYVLSDDTNSGPRIELRDTVLGLPPAADVLLAARPADTVPIHDGDVTHIRARIELGGGGDTDGGGDGEDK